MAYKRLFGFLGVGTWIWFWSASFVIGALRPSYSPITQTLSELGARGTSNAWLWNVFGFMVTGTLVAITGVAIARTVISRPSISRIVATILFVVAGLAIVGQGLLPADMINGGPDVTSPHTRAHFLSSLISGPAWIIGVLILTGPMKRNPEWRSMWIIGLALVVLIIIASFTLNGVLPDGIAQRTGNAIFCIWYVLMSLKLIQLGRNQR